MGLPMSSRPILQKTLNLIKPALPPSPVIPPDAPLKKRLDMMMAHLAECAELLPIENHDRALKVLVELIKLRREMCPQTPEDFARVAIAHGISADDFIRALRAEYAKRGIPCD
jgi:hypothetical protein